MFPQKPPWHPRGSQESTRFSPLRTATEWLGDGRNLFSRSSVSDTHTKEPADPLAHAQRVLNLPELSLNHHPCPQCLLAVSEDSVLSLGTGLLRGRQEAGRSFAADRVATVLRTLSYTDGATPKTADGSAWDRSDFRGRLDISAVALDAPRAVGGGAWQVSWLGCC